MIQDNPNALLGARGEHYIGNVMLLVPQYSADSDVRPILRLPAAICIPSIRYLDRGVYSGSSSLFDVWMLAAFGLLGSAMRKLDSPSAPLILGLVLGDSMELALRQSLMMSQGDPAILVSPRYPQSCSH